MISLPRSHPHHPAAAEAGADDGGGGGGLCVMYASVNGAPVTEHPSVGRTDEPDRQAGPDASSLTPADRCGGGGRSVVSGVNSPFTARPGRARPAAERGQADAASTLPPLHVVGRHA